jgi:type I restriction enzyme S subunit
LNSFCFGFRANSLEKLSPYFSQYLFRSENFRTEIIKLAQGSTRYNMSKIQLLKIEIQLPCLEEQTKIANFLSSIDEKINHTATQIEKMEVWKKGLLQKMFV